MKNLLCIIAVLYTCVFFGAEIFAGQKTFNSDSGSWGTALSWMPPGVPSASDTVTIPSPGSCTIKTSANCASLILQNGASLLVRAGLTVQGTTAIKGNISFASTHGIKTFTGFVTIGSTGVWNNSANEGITFQGGFANYGSFSSGTGTHIFNGNQSISGNPVIFNSTVSIYSGRTLTNYTEITITGNLTGGSSTSKFVNETNAVLSAGGTVMTTGQISASSGGNLINYCRAGNQTVKRTAYYNLTLSGSGTKTVSGVTINGRLSIQGTVVISGAPVYGSSAVLEYKGSRPQTTGAEFLSAMNGQVIIDNINGVTLNSSKTLNNNLILINGSITTSRANLLTLGADANITGGSSASFVNGPLAIIKNTAAQQNLFFPVGKNSSFRPLELIIQHSNTTSSAYITELFNSAPAGRTLPASLTYVSNVRYWNITKTGTASVVSAFVVLYYGADDGVTEPENLRIAKDNGSVWLDLGGTANGSPSGSILSNPFASFSDFVLANSLGGSNPLPAELSSFKASLKDNLVILSWITRTEVDNFGFEIQRGSIENVWAKIGFLEGHGNSNSPKEYSFSDRVVSGQKYFYRLRQIDTDGNYQYSNVLEVIAGQFPGEYILKQNYPNPFNASTRIEYAIPEESFVQLKVYDILGNELSALVNEYQPAGRYRAEFDAADLSSGIYIAKLTAGSFTKTMKMTLLK